MRKDRIGMRIQKKKRRTNNLMYSKARSRAAFEGLGVVATRDKPTGWAEVGSDVMVEMGGKEMESYFSSGPEER